MRFDSSWWLSGAVALLLLPAPTRALQGQEPLVAGADGVEVPKRTEFVQPVYPPEAAAQGLRGIVILELLIDEQGRVADIQVVRSVPPFDEAAIEAVRQWRYEPPEHEGRRVSVRLTVPITFLMKLPEITRQEGIPELRSGAVPPFPEGTRQPVDVVADVTLAPDGRVAQAEILVGEPAWAESLIRALRTWRFDDRELGEGVTVGFRVEARFIPRNGEEEHVDIQLTGLRRSESFPAPAEAPEPAAEAAPAAPPGVAGEEGTGAADAEAPAEGTGEAGAPDGSAPETEATTPEEPAAALPGEEAEAGTGAPGTTEPPAVAEPRPGVVPAPPENPSVPEAPASAEATGEGDAEAAPAEGEPEPGEASVEPGQEPSPPDAEGVEAPAQDADTEVLSAGGAPAFAPTPTPTPVEPGVSAVRGVFLEAGVPDLSQGRRPVMPPFARMQGVQGIVRVRFAVDAAGQSFVSAVDGPEALRLAARATVESWGFSRRSAARVYLEAEFTYEGTDATAVVRIEK